MQSFSKRFKGRAEHRAQPRIRPIPALGHNRIRVIFFDLGNVLVCFDAAKALEKYANAFGVDGKEIWKFVFTSEWERAFTKGEIEPKDFFEKVKQRFSVQMNFNEFADIWNDIFWANPGMEEVVAFLKGYYDLYLISNTNHLHFEFIKRNYSVLKHFKGLFPSHEVGHRKPEAEIYLHAMRHAKAEPHESIFIDDIAEFVDAARALGMNGIQFRDIPKLRDDLARYGIILADGSVRRAQGKKRGRVI